MEDTPESPDVLGGIGDELDRALMGAACALYEQLGRGVRKRPGRNYGC